MAQVARPLTPEASARHRFGAELRRWRLRRELSQDALGRLIHASGDLIAKIEKAQRWPSADFARRCDVVLDTNEALITLMPLLERERRRDRFLVQPPTTQPDKHQLVDLVASTFPADRQSSRAEIQGDPWTLRLPAGRMFAATSLNAWLTEPVARRPDHLTAATPPSVAARPGDLLVAQDLDGDQPRFYAVDARRRSRAEGGVAIPLAYLLDDFTIGILWASRTLDDALLNDDQLLAETLDRFRPSGAARGADALPTDDLTQIAQAWLGSYACARFISAHVGAPPGPPLFWTREQRGEEAATWLLFGHKIDYLRTLRARYKDRTGPMGRVFCLPEATAVTGPRAERVLLLLAAALMEAMGVAVHVCTEPDYSAVEGFVLTPDGTVIVANWLRADRVWHATVIAGRPAVGSYRDALRFGQAASIISADAPTDRLQRLADYLSLDWTWLTARAAQISAAGVTGLIRPRSRLLSHTGIETACRFLAVQPR
ncbi:helix-turn-helix domain-containing protein [Plantactinospora sp. CA-294935]|uniref:helix-turn-helix domain-containing protein n=1 Tax=Plantactinospora sp. CA-294935 TaxID=3240012 RepID=UPI003D8CC0F3